MREYISKHKKKLLQYGGIALFLLSIALISPYFLEWVNRILNSWFPKQQIQLEDYLNYMAAVWIGLLAVVISVLALHVTIKAERREQQNNLYLLNISKRILREYIESASQVYYDIARSQGACSALKQVSDIDNHIERLHANSILSDDEEKMCRRIMGYVKTGLDTKRGIEDNQLAKEYCSIFLGPDTFRYEIDLLETLFNIEKRNLAQSLTNIGKYSELIGSEFITTYLLVGLTKSITGYYGEKDEDREKVIESVTNFIYEIKGYMKSINARYGYHFKDTMLSEMENYLP